MLFAIPDEFACSDPQDQVPGCTPGQYATSFRNRIYNNVFGRTPKTKSRASFIDPNGQDLWWDEGGLNPETNDSGNCWFNNTGRDGTAASLKTVPSQLPADCANSRARGQGHPPQNGELIVCLTDMSPTGPCPWFKTPSEP
jgi:hypothetical protein